MALELGRRHIAVVLQNPSWRELWRRRCVCCNKAVVVAPTHGPHGPRLLQAIGHQLHDIVKLPLAKLAKSCETRMRAARTLAWRLCRASGAAGWRLLCRAGSAAGRRLLCQAGGAGGTKPPNPHSPPGPCYTCYMCSMGLTRQAHSPPGAICAIWLLQGKPLNLHSPPAPCYMCYMCYMALYSTYSTDFRACRISI